MIVDGSLRVQVDGVELGLSIGPGEITVDLPSLRGLSALTGNLSPALIAPIVACGSPILVRFRTLPLFTVRPGSSRLASWLLGVSGVSLAWPCRPEFGSRHNWPTAPVARLTALHRADRRLR